MRYIASTFHHGLQAMLFHLVLRAFSFVVFILGALFSDLPLAKRRTDRLGTELVHFVILDFQFIECHSFVFVFLVVLLVLGGGALVRAALLLGSVYLHIRFLPAVVLHLRGPAHAGVLLRVYFGVGLVVVDDLLETREVDGSLALEEGLVGGSLAVFIAWSVIECAIRWLYIPSLC